MSEDQNSGRNKKNIDGAKSLSEKQVNANTQRP